MSSVDNVSDELEMQDFIEDNPEASNDNDKVIIQIGHEPIDKEITSEPNDDEVNYESIDEEDVNDEIYDVNDEPIDEGEDVNDEIYDVNDEPIDEGENVNDINEEKTVGPKKKRGLPKTMLANQQKYLEALEKQQRMINTKKEKNKSNNKSKGKSKVNDTPKIVTSTTMQPGMRRVIVAGKVKYIPIRAPEPLISHPEEKHIVETPPKKSEKKIPSALQKKMELHKAALTMVTAKTKNAPAKKIPSKYAKQMENDVKKQTIKSVKNFSDLRRIKAIQDLAPDANVDTNKASIIELRKLKMEQRKMEQLAQKKRSEANKRETAVQEILKNDKMSKFAKTVAIKNLSINSRNRKRKSVESKLD